MNRPWRETCCPDCKQVPKADGNGIVSCACNGKPYEPDITVTGTEDERAGFVARGFVETQDIRENVYYVGPLGHIVQLFADGTWRSDKAAKGSTLEEYLKSIPPDDAFWKK